ncbi:inositol-1-monophosphatase [Firmicutes bacterium CAG:791]|nr:inositol-1-monophosphatase [Firmicutes bacterium CAG:791]
MKDTNVLSDTNAAVNVNWLEQLLRNAGKLFQDRTLAGQTREKGVADYVTAVDYEVQQYIRTQLEEQYPRIQFLSEEKSNDDVDRSGLVWVLDPVDGTTNLIHDYQASVISLALMDKGESVLGMIYDPYMNELFLAEKGKGSFCNGRRIHVSRAASMEECLIAIGTSPYYKELAEKNFDLFKRLFMDCQDVRRSGSAARDLAYVACGRLDGYLEQRLKIWDFAAGMLLVREAGGCVRDYQGADLGATMTGDVVAANAAVSTVIRENYL